MLRNSILILLVLASVQSKDLSMQQGASISQAFLQLESCSISIPLIISCDGSTCSVTVDADGYSATVDVVDGNYVFITVTDTDSSDNSQDCTEIVSATVACNEQDNCPFDGIALVVVTLPDGSGANLVEEVA